MNWTESRPWGRFLNLLDTQATKVKLIEVDPGSRLSYQSHSRRSESWTVVQGEALVVLEEREYVLRVGQHIEIPVKAKHRVGNLKQEKLQIIEVQTGSYFGEDDIVRYQDDFGR